MGLASTGCWHIVDAIFVIVKAYKGYGDLYKFVLDEEIDHGRR